MSLKLRKIQCILCNGVVALDENKTRFKEHLDHDHAVIANTGQSWVMAVSLLDQERREKILATIMDSVTREPQESGEQELLTGGVMGERTKVILNIDISDDEADGDWDKNFERVVSPEKSFVELDESFGENTDQEKLVGETMVAIKSSKDKDKRKRDEQDVSAEQSSNETQKTHDSVQENKMALFECKFCDHKSRTSFALKKHVKNHHSMSDTDITDMIIKEEAVQVQGKKEEEEREMKKQEKENKTNKKKTQLANKNNESSRRRKSRSHPLQESETNIELNLTENNDGSKILEEIDRFSQSLKRKLSPNKAGEGEPKSNVKRRRTVLERHDESLSNALTFESKETKKDEENKEEGRNVSENIKNKRRSKKVGEEVKGDVIQTSESENQTSSSPAVTEEDETLKEDLLNISPTVDLSGSSYFQFHQSMIKSINVKDIKYESLSRESGLPNNWFVYTSFFNGGKRKVKEYITPDRKLVRGKTAAVEFMRASNEYTEVEINAVADHLGVKFNK